MNALTPNGQAPANPDAHPVWACARKDMVGTALGTSRVWFTLAQGVVSEEYYPRIDIPQIRDLGLIIADGAGFSGANCASWGNTAWRGPKRFARRDADPSSSALHLHHARVLRPGTRRAAGGLPAGRRRRAGAACIAGFTLGRGRCNNRAWAEDWHGHPVLWAEQGHPGLATATRRFC